MSQPATLRSLAEQWPHDEDIYTAGDLGGQRQSKIHSKACRRCQLDALLDAWQAHLDQGCSDWLDTEITQHILGTRAAQKP
jgi:hypothetical protein